MRGGATKLWLIAAVAAATLALPAVAGASFVVYTASGANAAAIQATVDQFRTDLGANNGAGGTFPSGRREINWDGVPDNFAAPNAFPANFFNVNSPRGVVFSTAGTGFQVSADSSNPTSTPVRFGNIDPTYPVTFGTFSAERLFTALGSTVTDVNFFIPGTATPAYTSAFGVVFTDNDGAISSLQFFDTANNPLASIFPASSPGAQATLAFVALRFTGGEKVGRVRITAGNTPLGTGVVDNGSSVDVVALDDFIYGEPQTIPTAITVRSASAVRTRHGVAIRWRTAWEASTVGFRVYREQAGKRVQVSRSLVPAVFGGTASGHAYSFVDRTAPRGALRYWIRAVGLDGSASWLGSVRVR
jgi:hypothetical protein